MPTPLATIADALIEFILSLLRDPNALAEFEAEPEQALARNGLSNICLDDVRSVVPVVVERPDVTPVVVRAAAPAPVIKPVIPVAPAPQQPQPPVVKEILNVANNFHIDNRSTIIDQSVNQNIWAQGDVTQIFDQEAVLAMGENSVAVGDNALIDNSKTDVTVGDVAIGNTDTDIVITDSLNDHSTNVDVTVGTDVADSFNDQSSSVVIDTVVSESFQVNDSFQADTSTAVSSDVTIQDSTVYAGAAPYDAPVVYEPQIGDESPTGYESTALEVVPPLEMEYEESQ